MFAEHNFFRNMKFVDRTEETKRLKEALSRDKSTFAVVWGRRRLGKSTLIKRVLTDDDIYFLAERDAEPSQQKMSLAKVIARTFPDFDKVTYPDWESVLRVLNYRATNRFTLCIDELPFLAEHSPELPSVLQKLLDEKQLKYNIVVCGSSQNMMYGLILDSTAPLYGRADVIIKMTPIRLPHIQDALGLGAEDAVREYAVWGGVPRYWELRESAGSFEDALWQNVFSPNGVLYEEPAKLFRDDIRDIVKTSTIMSYIGLGANRLSKIASMCGEPATNLSRPLGKLVDLGFIEKEVPFGVSEKDSKKSLYRIADPFMSFYYRFVVPNRSFIEMDRHQIIRQSLDDHFPEFAGMRWEKICRDAVTGNVVRGVLYGKASRWWGSVINENSKPEQIEIDLVAESYDRKSLLVGECKWTSGEYGKLLTAELLRKASLLPMAKGHDIVPVLFLKGSPLQDIGNVLLPEDVIELSSI